MTQIDIIVGAILRAVYEYIKAGEEGMRELYSRRELCSHIVNCVDMVKTLPSSDPVALVNAVGEVVVEDGFARGFESMEVADNAISLNFWGCGRNEGMNVDIFCIGIVLISAMQVKFGRICDVEVSQDDDCVKFLLKCSSSEPNECTLP